jgi:hypothetical protein
MPLDEIKAVVAATQATVASLQALLERPPGQVEAGTRFVWISDLLPEEMARLLESSGWARWRCAMIAGAIWRQ